MLGEPAKVALNGMAADQQLQRLLDKLSAPPKLSKKCREVAPSPPLGLVSGILDEIDETLMARRLVMTNGQGDRMSLEVCNRRLLQVEVTTATGKDDGLAAQHLTYAGAGDLSTLFRVLSEFSVPGTITVTSQRPTGSATLEETGIAAETLRQNWNQPSGVQHPAALPEGTNHRPHDLTELCAEIAPLASAWILDDPDRESRGDGADIDLDQLVAAVDALDFDWVGPENSSAAIGICLDGEGVLVVCAGDAVAAMILQPGKMTEALAYTARLIETESRPNDPSG